MGDRSGICSPWVYTQALWATLQPSWIINDLNKIFQFPAIHQNIWNTWYITILYYAISSKGPNPIILLTKWVWSSDNPGILTWSQIYMSWHIGLFHPIYQTYRAWIEKQMHQKTCTRKYQFLLHWSKFRYCRWRDCHLSMRSQLFQAHSPQLVYSRGCYSRFSSIPDETIHLHHLSKQ